MVVRKLAPFNIFLDSPLDEPSLYIGKFCSREATQSMRRHMAPIKEQKHTTSAEQQVMLDAELQLWNHTFGYVKSMALKAAIDLGIPEAIHQHGGTATLPQIVTRVKLHPSKTPCLRRLMRVLTLTGVFGAQEPHDDDGGCDDELVYTLTPASRLLVGSPGQNVGPFLTLMLGPIFVSSFLDLRGWFQHETPDPSPFKMTHGRDIWELAAHDAAFGRLFDAGMVADSSFIMDVVVRECGGVFEGISSLVDVAGGLGGATQTIAKAFPNLECSVLDLPNVVASAPADTAVKYVPGDMFESVPAADAVFLKVGLFCEIYRNKKVNNNNGGMQTTSHTYINFGLFR
jgi:hypothetical protein